MTPARVIALVQALGGADWSSLASNPALTVTDVVEAVLPVFGPGGTLAADGVALFIALARAGIIRPDPDPIHDAQTRDTPHSGRRS